METYKIYQINMLRDRFGVCFESYDRALKLSNKEHIDFSIYDLVHDDLLEFLYEKYNFRFQKTQDIKFMRSLSVSDIVEIDGRFFYCEPIGWKEIEV